MENVIEVEGLTKMFGDFTAVDHISFTSRKGEIFGLLGPNGAGKSTTVKMLTTLLHPTAGSARICGHDVVQERDAVRGCISIVFQDRSIDWELTGKQNLDLHAGMYNLGGREKERRMNEVLDLLELQGKENVRLIHAPQAVRRRFEVARGFMTSPDVVFLDEPTIGFDIKARMDLWEQIRRAKEAEGSTVLLITHYIEEADFLCDRVAIIDHAKIIAMGTPDELKAVVGEDLLTVQIAEGERARERFTQEVPSIPWVRKVTEYGNSISLTVTSGEGRLSDLADFADGHGFSITALDERKPSLEDVFIHFTGETIREAEGSSDTKAKRSMRKAGR
jgi:ABC-2 type transport system ATP-binding protein